MKLLAINGSGRKHGNTASLLVHCMENLPRDIEIQIIHLSELDFGGCIGCEGCAKTQTCVVKDDMMSIYPLIEQEEVKDMGFTIEAMSMPLEALGYRVVNKTRILNCFAPKDIHKYEEAKEATLKGVTKLYKTISLKDQQLNR